MNLTKTKSLAGKYHYAFYMVMAMVLMLIMQSLMADSLTYSPDQWPRRWNRLIQQTSLQDQLNGHAYTVRPQSPSRSCRCNQPPRHSRVWGVVPSAGKKSRRSTRPDYSLATEQVTPPTQAVYPGYGFGAVYPSVYGNPYINPVIAPGLAAPAIPTGVYPFITPLPGTPYLGGVPYYPSLMPVPGYIW